MPYDPNEWRNMRAQGMANLANLAQNRTRFNDYEFQKQQEAEERLRRQEKQQALDNSRGAFGMAGSGAGIGAMVGGPVGAAIGGGAGLLLGGLAEAKQRKSIKGGSMLSNFGQSLMRAPSFQELPAIAGGAAGAIGAYKAAQPKVDPAMNAASMNQASQYADMARANRGMEDDFYNRTQGNFTPNMNAYKARLPSVTQQPYNPYSDWG